jgi:hypothetical protein
MFHVVVNYHLIWFCKVNAFIRLYTQTAVPTAPSNCVQKKETMRRNTTNLELQMLRMKLNMHADASQGISFCAEPVWKGESFEEIALTHSDVD